MVQIDGHPGVGPRLVPGRVITAVDQAPAADAHVAGVGHGNNGMQHRAAGQVQGLIVLQGDGVHHPFPGADVKHVGVAGVRHVRFQGIGENVQGLVHIVIEYHGVLARLRDQKADLAVLHLRLNAPRAGQHLRALHRLGQPRHFDFHPDRSFKIKIGHGGGGGLSVGVPDMLVVHHHIVHEQLMSVHADAGRWRVGHGLGAFVDGKLRLSFFRRCERARGQAKHCAYQGINHQLPFH